MDQISIIIVDDHPLMRQGLKAVIQTDAEFVVVAEAGDGETALKHIEQLKPQIAVLDIDMPKLDGFGVAREIRRQELPTKVVFLTIHDDDDLFQAAIDLGSYGYILKDSALSEITGALRGVHQGRYYVPPALMGSLLQRSSKPASNTSSKPKWEQLTAAERKVLALIAIGKSSKEIANELSIHYKTVENHRTNMSQKLGVSGPHALMRFALQHRADL